MARHNLTKLINYEWCDRYPEFDDPDFVFERKREDASLESTKKGYKELLFEYNLRKDEIIRNEIKNDSEGKLKELQDELLGSNKDLIKSIANRYARKYSQYINSAEKDFFQEGSTGMLLALDKYDHGISSFRYYFEKWMTWNILSSLHDEVIITLPSAVFKIEKVYNDLYMIEGIKPTLSELSKKVKISEKRIENIFKTSGRVVSLDVDINEEESFADTIGDKNADGNQLLNKNGKLLLNADGKNLLDKITTQELIGTMKGVIKAYEATNIKNREKIKVLYEHYLKNKDFDEIGKKFKFTRQRASQIDQDTRIRLRYRLNKFI